MTDQEIVDIWNNIPYPRSRGKLVRQCGIGKEKSDRIMRKYGLKSDFNLCGKGGALGNNAPPEVRAVIAKHHSLPTDDPWEKMRLKVPPRVEADCLEFNDGKPIALAFLSDLHLGSKGTDYAAAFEDAKIVQQTEGMYSIIVGDMTDNWVVPALQHLQREQSLMHSEAMRMLKRYMEWTQPIAVVAGNHDLWTNKMSGIDILREWTPETAIYDMHEIVAKLKHGDSERILKIRHKWRGNSIYNPTHGIEVDLQRGHDDWDIAIGGHVHKGTMLREFYHRDRKRLAILVGAYKVLDSFQREVGFKRQTECGGRGCGAYISFPDGKWMCMPDLKVAAEFLKFIRR